MNAYKYVISKHNLKQIINIELLETNSTYKKDTKERR